MADNPSTYNRFVAFEPLLQILRNKGFMIGIDTHMRIHALLNQLPEDVSEQQLKFLIGPIVASSPQEQTIFYQEYDLYVKRSRTLNAKAPRPQIPKEPTQRSTKAPEKPATDRRWIYGVIGMVVIGLVFYLVLQSGYPDTTTTPPDQVLPPTENPTTTEPTDWINTITILGGVLFLLLGIGASWWVWQNYLKPKKDLFLKSEKAKPNFSFWNIPLPIPKLPLIQDPLFLKATRLMRLREATDIPDLDVEKTLEASINHIGFPVLQYRYRSRFPEYLILIDQNSTRDHQALLFEQFFQEIKRLGLFAVRYYFKDVPTHCWDSNNQGFTLEELYRKYPEHRLLIFGDANAFLDPISGKAPKWMGQLHEWPQKAVLNIQEPDKNLLRQLKTYPDLVLLKASLENLTYLHYAFFLPEVLQKRNKTNGQVKVNYTDPETYNYLSPDQTIEQLQEELAPTTFDWLCACTIYPELNWSLTLFLGEELFGEKARQEKVFFELISLPWFRQGFIPEKIRLALQKELTEGQVNEIRRLVLQLIKDNPPADAAPEKEKYDYQLFIALEESLLQPDNKDKKQDLRQQADGMERKRSRYRQVVLQYLNEEQDKTGAFALPEWVNNLFKPKEERVKPKFIYPKVVWWRRAGAYLVDLSPFLFSIVLLLIAIEGTFDFLPEPEGTIGDIYVLLILITSISMLRKDSHRNWINGKKTFDIQTISIYKNHKVGLSIRIIRNLLSPPSFLFVILGIVILSNFEDVPSFFESLGVPVLLGLDEDYTLFWFIFIPSIVEFLVLLFSPTGRVPHDYLAGTQVVNKQDYLYGRTVDQSQPTPETTSNQLPIWLQTIFSYPKVAWWRRSGAYIVDTGLYFGIILGLQFSGLVGQFPLRFIFSIATVLFILKEYRTEWSLGKRILSLQVVDLGTNKKNSFLSALIRTLFSAPMLFTLAVWFSVIFAIDANQLLESILPAVFDGISFQTGLFIAFACIFTPDLINGIVFLFNPSGRTISDYFARTQVVNQQDYLYGKTVEQVEQEAIQQPQTAYSLKQALERWTPGFISPILFRWLCFGLLGGAGFFLAYLLGISIFDFLDNSNSKILFQYSLGGFIVAFCLNLVADLEFNKRLWSGAFFLKVISTSILYVIISLSTSNSNFSFLTLDNDQIVLICLSGALTLICVLQFPFKVSRMLAISVTTMLFAGLFILFLNQFNPESNILFYAALHYVSHGFISAFVVAVGITPLIDDIHEPELKSATDQPIVNQQKANFQKATLWRRFLAWLMDNTISFTLAISYSFYAAAYGDQLEIAILLGGLAFLYILFRDGFWGGQSLGKRILSVKVVRLGRADERINFLYSAFRRVDWVSSLILLFILFYVEAFNLDYYFQAPQVQQEEPPFPYLLYAMAYIAVLLDTLFAIFHPKGQSIGDLIAGTMVVDAARSSTTEAIQKQDINIQEQPQTSQQQQQQQQQQQAAPSTPEVETDEELDAARNLLRTYPDLLEYALPYIKENYNPNLLYDLDELEGLNEKERIDLKAARDHFIAESDSISRFDNDLIVGTFTTIFSRLPEILANSSFEEQAKLLKKLKLSDQSLEAVLDLRKAPESISPAEQAERDQFAISMVRDELNREFAVKRSSERFTEVIQQASPSAQSTIFQQAKYARNENWKSNKDVMERTIPIFEALVDPEDPDANYTYLAQLAYAIKDQENPSRGDLMRALSLLNDAIEKRPPSSQTPSERLYEFNRAILNILLDREFQANRRSVPEFREMIVDDLEQVTSFGLKPGIEQDLDAYRETPIDAWCRLNNIPPFIPLETDSSGSLDPLELAEQKEKERDELAITMVQDELTRGFAVKRSQDHFNEVINEATETAKAEIFRMARQVRSENWNTDKAVMERTIPIFEALVASDNEMNHHRYRGQLAYALKDQREPSQQDLQKALELLEDAMTIRQDEFKNIMYDFNYAILQILLDRDYQTNKPTNPELVALINRSLEKVKDSKEFNYLREDLDAFKQTPINQWCRLNGLEPFISTGDFTLLSQPEIERLVQLASGPSEEFGESLLIFKTSTQQTWLATTSLRLFCLLDDEKSARDNSRIQWNMPLEEAQDLTNISFGNYTERTGLVNIGSRKRWMFSYHLFGDRADFEEALKAFLGIVPSNLREEQNQNLPRESSAPNRAVSPNLAYLCNRYDQVHAFEDVFYQQDPSPISFFLLHGAKDQDHDGFIESLMIRMSNWAPESRTQIVRNQSPFRNYPRQNYAGLIRILLQVFDISPSSVGKVSVLNYSDLLRRSPITRSLNSNDFLFIQLPFDDILSNREQILSLFNRFIPEFFDQNELSSFPRTFLFLTVAYEENNRHVSRELETLDIPAIQLLPRLTNVIKKEILDWFYNYQDSFGFTDREIKRLFAQHFESLPDRIPMIQVRRLLTRIIDEHNKSV